MKQEMQKSKPENKAYIKSFYVSILMLIPVLALLVSGSILVLGYHQHHISDEILIMGLSKFEWRDIHIYSAITSVILITYHLTLLKNWLKKYFLVRKIANKKHRTSRRLLWIFGICALTGLIPWLGGFFSERTHAFFMFVEIHDKLGLVLVVFVVIHVINHFKFLMSVYRKIRTKGKAFQPMATSNQTNY